MSLNYWHELGRINSLLVEFRVELWVEINSLTSFYLNAKNKTVKPIITQRIPNGINADEVKEYILKDVKLANELNGKEIKKIIFIPSRLANIIV